MPVDLHRRIKDFLELLKFNCPGCSEVFMYQQMYEHVKTCEDAVKIYKEGRATAGEKKDHQAVMLNRRITMAEKFTKAHKQEEVVPLAKAPSGFPDVLFIFQKDSKTISLFNVNSKALAHKQVDFRGNFPHNFQMIQVGAIDPKCFMIGGGDNKTLPDSMFQCRELVKTNQSANYQFTFKEKKKMKFARHGHSCCAIADRYVMVSGSRKEVNSAQSRVEIFDTEINEWMELAQLNEGRHYHSSTNFNNKYVYVFGGIQNANKKYSASFERMQFSLTNFNHKWESINVHANADPQNQITARQGAGMCQLSPNEIMVVGGFNGKFCPDYFYIECDQNTGNINKFTKMERKESPLFPF